MLMALASCITDQKERAVYNGQGEMAGEVTQNSIILQTRLTATNGLVEGDLTGKAGYARFEWSTDTDFKSIAISNWQAAKAENDFIVKKRLKGLAPATQYWYRVRYGEDTLNTYSGSIASFRTLPAVDSSEPIGFIVTSCYNYSRFHYGRLDKPGTGYQGEDRTMGYPGLAAVKSLKPDFVVFTGDNVYYDTPQTDSLRAKSQAQLRKKWHEQFVQSRFIDLFSSTATYWEKDDHDHRFNDSDTVSGFTLLPHLLLGDKPDSLALAQPSHRLGVSTFREQVPVVDPLYPGAVTYRTHRLNQHVQVWFTENRDYRSPNNQPDGLQKTMWGKEQKEWLKQTLLESDADFKLLISPTPIVGPDDAYKNDNHVNERGFRYEGQNFLNWIDQNQSTIGKFYIVHGDRHWQYHSIHPYGIEEFSVGAIDATNAREPRLPGDSKSTDPMGLIKQSYVASKVTGGFLRIWVGQLQDVPSLQFTFYDEKGNILYETVKSSLQE